jgi:hypothetical protein
MFHSNNLQAIPKAYFAQGMPPNVVVDVEDQR